MQSTAAALQLGPEPRYLAGLTGFVLLPYSCLHTTALSAATTTEEGCAELGVTAGLASPSLPELHVIQIGSVAC